MISKLLIGLTTSFTMMILLAYLCLGYFSWIPHIGVAALASLITMIFALLGFFRFLDVLANTLIKHKHSQGER